MSSHERFDMHSRHAASQAQAQAQAQTQAQRSAPLMRGVLSATTSMTVPYCEKRWKRLRRRSCFVIWSLRLLQYSVCEGCLMVETGDKKRKKQNRIFWWAGEGRNQHSLTRRDNQRPTTQKIQQPLHESRSDGTSEKRDRSPRSLNDRLAKKQL